MIYLYSSLVALYCLLSPSPSINYLQTHFEFTLTVAKNEENKDQKGFVETYHLKGDQITYTFQPTGKNNKESSTNNVALSTSKIEKLEKHVIDNQLNTIAHKEFRQNATSNSRIRFDLTLHGRSSTIEITGNWKEVTKSELGQQLMAIKSMIQEK